LNRFEGQFAAAEIGEPHPAHDRALAWCRIHAPPAPCFSICHGDYKPDDVLHEDGRILAVVDWERAEISDPIADLAYVCVPLLRAGGLAVGLAGLDYVVRRYHEETGFEVDESHLLFCEILLMLHTVFYFQSLIADGRRRGKRASPLEPLVPRLIGLIEEALG
jgi:aminoglycoside phosphotransferase (APT) family kinase protein